MNGQLKKKAQKKDRPISLFCLQQKAKKEQKKTLTADLVPAGAAFFLYRIPLRCRISALESDGRPSGAAKVGPFIRRGQPIDGSGMRPRIRHTISLLDFTGFSWVFTDCTGLDWIFLGFI